MASWFNAMAKSIGPKLVIALGLGGAAWGAMQMLDRPTAPDAEPIAAQAASPAAEAAAPPTTSAQPVERRSDQPMEIDPRALTVKRVLAIDGPFRHGDYVWDEKGAPATGPVIITIDLKAETLSVFRDGYEIGAAVILYGATDKPSPLGAFPITQKDEDHVSNLYDARPSA